MGGRGEKRVKEFVPPEQLHSRLALFPRWHVLALALPEQVKNCEGRARNRARRGGAGQAGWVARWREHEGEEEAAC